MSAAAPAAAAAAKPVKADAKGKKDAKVEEPVDNLIISNAEYGKVVTRFPPEASGFIHIGHAKAALVDRMLADKYGGKMVFRFDDTNPDKEKHEFEQAILDDMAVLGVTYEIGPTYSSDYMDIYIEKALQMIKEGTAYCDTTDRETMQKQRFDGIASACRDNTFEQNMALWKEMTEATDLGRTACLRAKISVDNPNKAMRDPVLFRVNTNPHARQGRKYNLYPTYDFCCPIIDSVEGVTHALRTNEYHDRNAQYDWILDALKMRKPILEDFSRLNMEYAVMSKRKLTQLVEDGVVDGWDDPRFPTIRALVRRGLKIEALREFVKVQGMSKAVNFMEWSKLWNFNIQVLDPSVPRYTVVSKDLKVKCTVVGGGEQPKAEELKKPKHAKNAELGEKTYYRNDVFFLDAEDVALLNDGDQVTLMSWGNAYVKNIAKDENGMPITADIELNLSGDVKATKYKLTWVPDLPDKTIDIICNEYDHLLTKKKPEPEEPLDGLIAPVTKFSQNVIGEAAMKDIKKGDFMQLERRGYYIVDAVNPLTLIAIPDGKEKVNHLSAKYQYLKTLPPMPAAAGDKTAAPKKASKGTKADENMSLEEKRAAKAAKKAAQQQATKDAKEAKEKAAAEPAAEPTA